MKPFGQFEKNVNTYYLNEIAVFGRNVRLICAQRHITISRLAKEVGISRNYIYLIMGGERIPHCFTLIKMAQVVEMPLTVLFNPGNSGVTALF